MIEFAPIVKLAEEPRDADHFIKKYAGQPITRNLLAAVDHDLRILEREDAIERQLTPAREASKTILQIVRNEINRTLFG